MGVDPYIATIGIFAGNFAVRNWALCDGQLMPIAQNQALFSIIGTIYGGDGRTTYALPDLRGRTPIHMGTGPGLSPRPIGQRSGTEYNVLNSLQLPSHNHSLQGVSVGIPALPVTGTIDVQVSDNEADSIGPNLKGLALFTSDSSGDQVKIYDKDPTYSGKKISGVKYDLSTTASTGTIASGNTGLTGANQAVNNMQPYLVVNYQIALFGTYPPRN